MTNRITISVVIPTKNRAHTLSKCIDSVLDQTHAATEIIVVDDASTDHTRELIQNYGDRVNYSLLPHGSGAQAARNHGIEIAKGEWIAFHDSDDIWLPDKLAIQVEALRSRNFDKKIVVHGNGIKLNETDNTKLPLLVPLTAGKCYRQLLLKPAPMFPTLLVSKEAILKSGGLDNGCPSYQEWDTAIRLAKNCEFIHIQQPLFAWIWHAGETISKDFQRDILGFGYVIKTHQQEIIANHGYRTWRRLKMNNIARALGAKLWDDAEAMLVEEDWHPSVSLAKLCANQHFFPKGAKMLLRLMTV